MLIQHLLCARPVLGEGTPSPEETETPNKEITKRRVLGCDRSCSFRVYGISTSGSTLTWAVGSTENKTYKNKNNFERNNPPAPMELTLRRVTDSKQNSV